MQYLGVRFNIHMILFQNGDEIYVGMITIRKWRIGHSPIEQDTHRRNRTLTDGTGHSPIEQDTHRRNRTLTDGTGHSPIEQDTRG